MISQGFRDSLKRSSVQRWDPRPDLVEDHDLVELVLQAAVDLRQDGAFRFLDISRCQGLRIARDATTSTGLRLVWDEVACMEGDTEIRGRAAVVPRYIDPSKGEDTPARQLARALEATLRKAASRLPATSPQNCGKVQEPGA